MILTDMDIREMVMGDGVPVISPFAYEQINPASYDLTLGENMRLECVDGFRSLTLKGTTPRFPFYLDPGGFCLLESREKFNLPNNICAQVCLKSSRAREGYNHLLAGWCDPGWRGSVLTMEVKNERQFAQIPLWSGMRLVQMVFMLTNGPVGTPYQGSYNNDTTVQESKYPRLDGY